MNARRHPTRVELLELDLDTRMTELWTEAGAIEEWTLEVAAAFMRAAYGKGYCDALAEAERGELMKAHGYRMPERGDLRRAA